MRPASEIYCDVYDDIDPDDEDSDIMGAVVNIEQLSVILEQLKNYNILGSLDYRDQIISLGGVDKEAVDIALKYIEEAEGDLVK
ncbi:hypothetical protein D3C71_1634620 [compost metagenome]